MSEISGARIIAQQLKNEGIDTVFGIVAGPMIEVMAAMAAAWDTAAATPYLAATIALLPRKQLCPEGGLDVL